MATQFSTNRRFVPPRQIRHNAYYRQSDLGDADRLTQTFMCIPPSKPDANSKTLEWLKLRHLIDETEPDILNTKSLRIFDVFGGIKCHLKSLLNHPTNSYCNKQQLSALINLLQEDDDNISTKKNKNNTNNKKNKTIYHINTLPNDMTSYLCSFLSFAEIHFLEITCSELAYVCLDELKKVDIGVMDFNSIIGKADILNLGKGNELISNHRMYANTTLATAFNKWMDEYDIPASQTLFYPLKKVGRISHRVYNEHMSLTTHIDQIHVVAQNYILFDLRNVYKIGKDACKTDSVWINCFNAIILKYFDIEQQKLYIVGAVLILINNMDCIMLDLINTILHKVVANNILKSENCSTLFYHSK